MKTSAKQLVGSPGVRIVLLVAIYVAVLSLSQWVAYLVRFDFVVPPQFELQMTGNWWWVIALKLFLLLCFGQFAGLLSYFSVPDLRRLLYAVASSSLVLLGLRYYAEPFFTPPRGVVLMDFLLSFGGLAAVRLGFRLIRERFLTPQSRLRGRARRVGIIGAGDAGASLARELTVKRGLGLHPVAFFDDDRNKWRSRIHDIPVIGPPEVLLNQKLNLELEKVIIAMPSTPARRIGEIVKVLQQARLKFETVPSMDQLATGKVKISQLRSVEIQDLLGREPVKLETEHIRRVLRERTIMVTGAGGSIGSELCRQIATFDPSRLLLVEQSEVQMYAVELELLELGYGGIVLPLVADILDEPRMRYLFKRFHPEVIFHSAAHKHVPMMEYQPTEAIKNNTFGTASLAELAMEFAVDRFVLISTDKAINPTSVMGATKRLAETFVQSLHASQPDRTKFMAVRFGNVLGSSGSVIPVFNRQIAAGGPVKVTHPEVTRYFMTIPEASGLVLQSAAQGSGGEIFVLDMGKPIRIVDLARQLIELSGLKPDEDIQIEFVGLRPGEKLFEELSYKAENFTATAHPKIMRLRSQPMPLKTLRELLSELQTELYRVDANQLKMLIQKAVPEYQPYVT